MEVSTYFRISSYICALLHFSVHILHVIAIKSRIFLHHYIYSTNVQLRFCHVLLT